MMPCAESHLRVNQNFILSFRSVFVERAVNAATHELFHVTEYRKRDCIFTQTEKVELWKKPFSNRSRILCLGEIAGMEFARCLTGITCTPYVLDVLMMYGYDKEAATALYEEIAAFAGNGEGKEG